MEAVLILKDLSVSYFTSRGEVKAVNEVNLNVKKSEKFGLAGESGCGKSTLANAILRLIKPPGKIVGGEILVDGINVLNLEEEELRKFRWKKVSMIFQGAMNSLNPTHRIDSQIGEAILAHEKISKEEVKRRVEELLSLVGIDPLRAKNYPFQLSGGMRQRVVIAMAIALNPSLLIADEPTTALDVLTERRILNMLKNIQNKFEFSVLMISHDIDLLTNFSDRIGVMYAGNIVEIGSAKELNQHPLHPYTIGLLKSKTELKTKKFWSIRGLPPDLINPPQGCVFHPRCDIAITTCKKEKPILREIHSDHYVYCHMV